VNSNQFTVGGRGLRMNHKDLSVWKESMVLVKQVYLLTETFPHEELFGLSSQMRRCAVSIPSNIAEGSGRNSSKEFIHFCYISQGSLAELETQLLIAAELKYIESSHSIFNQLITVRKLLAGFIKHLQTRTH